MRTRLLNGFLFAEAVLLFVVALPLLLAASTRTEVLVLDAADPFLFLTHRQVLYVLGGCQLALSAFLLLSSKRQLQLVLTTWLAANLLVYHAGCVWYEAATLGSICHLTNRLPVSPWVFDWFNFGILGSMLLGSSFFLVSDWWTGRRRTTHPIASQVGEQNVATAI